MSLAEMIELVCLMEATARKPGNVHPSASFSDLCFADFRNAAPAIAAPLATIRSIGLGQAVLEAVQATRLATGTNVNLGIVLLLAPLAAVPMDIPLATGVGSILKHTSVMDAEQVYAAIRLAHPGGLGETDSQDISQRPTVTLYEAMSLAADRDLIAEQYVTDYQFVFSARRQLCQIWKDAAEWESSIIALQLWMMSCRMDSLIMRKCGREVARQAMSLAARVNDRVVNGKQFDPDQLREFDNWLRADGHRRNPGTTADLIAATLFTALRDGLIDVPPREVIHAAAQTGP